MQLTIFGATGGTGAQLVRAALDAGHRVTAVVRDPARVGLAHPRLRVVRGDVLDPPSMRGTLDGADAAVSALGAPGNTPTTVYSTGTSNILDEMRRAGVRRFIGISAVPVAREELGAFDRLIVYPVLRRLFGEGYADMGRMEEVLRHSDVDWTVVRPPQLTDKPPRGQYRMAVNRNVDRGRRIPRADLATAMLRLLEDPSAVRATVRVAS